MNTYGILLNGSHIDVSKTERGAKNFASRNGYDTVTIRYNCGYIAKEIAYKNKFGKWISLENGQIRYN
jgi:hypothetical protein